MYAVLTDARKGYKILLKLELDTVWATRHGCWEQNLYLLEEQQVFTAKHLPAHNNCFISSGR